MKIELRVFFCIKTDQISPDIFSLECGYNLAWLGVAGRRTAHASQVLYEWPLILPVVPSGNRHHALCDVSCRKLYTGWSTKKYVWRVYLICFHAEKDTGFSPDINLKLSKRVLINVAIPWPVLMELIWNLYRQFFLLSTTAGWVFVWLSTTAGWICVCCEQPNTCF